MRPVSYTHLEEFLGDLHGDHGGVVKGRSGAHAVDGALGDEGAVAVGTCLLYTSRCV